MPSDQYEIDNLFVPPLSQDLFDISSLKDIENNIFQLFVDDKLKSDVTFLT